MLRASLSILCSFLAATAAVRSARACVPVPRERKFEIVGLGGALAGRRFAVAPESLGKARCLEDVIAVGPGGAMLAVPGAGGWTMFAAGKEQPLEGAVAPVRFSPDGKQIAFVRANKLAVLDLASGAIRLEDVSDAVRLAWTASGLVALRHSRGADELFVLSSPPRRIGSWPGELQAFSAAGTKALVVSGDAARVIDLERGSTGKMRRGVREGVLNPEGTQALLATRTSILLDDLSGRSRVLAQGQKPGGLCWTHEPAWVADSRAAAWVGDRVVSGPDLWPASIQCLGDRDQIAISGSRELVLWSPSTGSREVLPVRHSCLVSVPGTAMALGGPLSVQVLMDRKPLPVCDDEKLPQNLGTLDNGR